MALKPTTSSPVGDSLQTFAKTRKTAYLWPEFGLCSAALALLAPLAPSALTFSGESASRVRPDRGKLGRVIKKKTASFKADGGFSLALFFLSSSPSRGAGARGRRSPGGGASGSARLQVDGPLEMLEADATLSNSQEGEFNRTKTP